MQNDREEACRLRDGGDQDVRGKTGGSVVGHPNAVYRVYHIRISVWTGPSTGKFSA